MGGGMGRKKGGTGWFFILIFCFRSFLLECTNREVRQAFCRILSLAVQTHITYSAPPVRLFSVILST